MTWKNTVLVNLGLVMVVSLLAMAQVPIGGGTTPGRHPGAARRARVEPCWQVAGVPKSAMEQRRVVSEQAQQQIESVCANTALSPAQKRAQIRQIRERERQELDALISPAQRAALKACREQRGHVSPPHEGGGRGSVLCGELATPHKGKHPLNEDEESDQPPEAQKPN